MTEIKSEDQAVYGEPKATTEDYEIRIQVKDNLKPVDIKFRSSRDVAEKFNWLIKETAEKCLVVMVDSQNGFMGWHLISKGGINSTCFPMTEIFKPCFLTNACAFFFIHNHPSGSVQPSSEDKKTVKDLTEVSKILGIKLVDSIIVSSGGYYSWADEGTIYSL